MDGPRLHGNIAICDDSPSRKPAETSAWTSSWVSTIVGERWRKLQPRQRQVWEEKAKKVAKELLVRSDLAMESSDCEGRSGPARAMIPKARHAWRSHVDTMRPKFGLRDRDRVQGGGIGAFQRVDASNLSLIHI